jgi:uncharacterized protein YhhL (DUF1145 family)
MLRRATILLNVAAAVLVLMTGLYVLIVFGDLFSPSAKMMIGMGVMMYSGGQLRSSERCSNKN